MRLWIDDIRTMPEDFDVWAKSATEALNILKNNTVTHISFDYDLGDVKETSGPVVTWEEHEMTGYDVASWVEGEAFQGNMDPVTYAVHSANPIGAKKIEAAMANATRYWAKNSK
jgi:hypothetical protein